MKNKYSYDAWGRPRNADTWVLKPINTASALTNLNDMQPRFDRGYTGHEIMAGFGLINMNGRLYDPYLQRFLSPDNVVQDAANAQNYNRYSYCLNNPLRYTDPTGYLNDGNKAKPLPDPIPRDDNSGVWDYLDGGRLRMFKSSFGEANYWSSGFGNTSGYRSIGNGLYINGKGALIPWAEVNTNYVLPNAERDPKTAASVMGIDIYSTYYCKPSASGAGGIVYSDTPTNLWFINYQVNNANFYSFVVNVNLGGGSNGGQGGLGASTFFGAVGTGGDVASMSNSTFRLMNGANGSISPKIYSSGWNGGSPARITTYSVSKISIGISTGANILTTGMAYRDVFKGSAQPITYVDAGVGTAGIVASYASYFHGVEIPVVGEFVAVYSALRLSWDVSWYMGANYGPSKWYGTDNTKWFK